MAKAEIKLDVLLQDANFRKGVKRLATEARKIE